MEGLLLAEAIEGLSGRLPLTHGTWSFPDARTAVLPLDDGTSLWLSSRPPQPRLELREGAPEHARPSTPFQQLLASRAVGPMAAVRQQGLDRVVEFDFAPDDGFAPRPRVTLVAELTGRNANLLLLDEARRILGVERVILHERNRYRELKPGVSYVPPPPYAKLDPREADPDALVEALRGRTLSHVKRVVDGVGPELTAALVEMSGAATGAALEGAELDGVVVALLRLARAPSEALRAVGGGRSMSELRRAERLVAARSDVRAERARRLQLADKRLRDAALAAEAGRDAERLRGEADLLMAYPHLVAEGAGRAVLPAFDGGEVELTLDPELSPLANARRRYERARKRQARGDRAEAQHPELERARAEAAAELAAVEGLAGDVLLREAGALRARREARRRPRGPGVRFVDPRGFEIVVGRNARDNDQVTFRLARSRDLWLHVQGYTGSHVVVRSGDREVPFDTVLFAARLAAGFSAARESGNVPVDYTRRKNVWKVKGQPAGAVHYSQQKTVYVTPARSDADAADAR